ncbi:helix-turn-helix transcriptional regulator [Brenneria goodwinii]|uniref:helix-turn-helix domain-containing protein n=1 Tax=Enterobacterales TaxID=91347 RepID=UPI000EF22849|nr:helix-turn-helix transcriptional regulator [Brenneria goodwinii]MCG8159014.1 helix-turn-helix transcriptional regulator [Brenneria goodwinii]MCG8161773.1 helix-turn-helix transcriptional regulator [Brenneria goodwinii]MCG8168263.1 helix-turn-helix transcriptional regulator [Brenneria goodwinii]MCG8172892.1 helix-turn-helix transcriptional regulator [Brenneria goodwinii]MCG8175343.1 helix-turn-helix transcriptional regulator [Brenneria goodwinii]
MASIYSEEYQSVIKTLRAARIRKGISQQSLAESLGRPQSFIAKVENGERRLDIVEFVHLARLLSIDPISIIGKLPAKHKPLSAK